MAENFSPFHSKSAIGFFRDVALVDRFGETGPTGAAVEFIERSKKGFAADKIDIDAGAMIVPILVSKRRFGAALLGDAILLRRELLF